MSLDDSKKHAADLALLYPSDIDATDFINEIEFQKHNSKTYSYYNICITIKYFKWYIKIRFERPSYPNIETTYKIFLSLPISVASCERGFSKLKIIKSYNRSTMSQERLSGLSILSIEHEIAKSINFDDVIHEFALAKARKIKF